MEKLKRFAQNLDNIKTRNNKSLTEFAQEIGIAKSTVQSILKDGNTTLDTAIRISTALGISLDDLLSEDIEYIENDGKDTDDKTDEKDGGEAKTGSLETGMDILKRVLSRFDNLDYNEQLELEYCIVRIMDILGKKK